MIIAMDGPAACGKTSTAQAVAAALSYCHIDTGAMYRAITLYLLEHEICENQKAAQRALANISLAFRSKSPSENKLYLNGVCVEEEIRSMRVSERVSEVSSWSFVREKLVGLQQHMGLQRDVVAEGRDIGTVVFPHAALKIYMTASLEVRAGRRFEQQRHRKDAHAREEIARMLQARDRLDMSRTDSPLRRAKDAHVLDTTLLTFEEQVAHVIRWHDELQVHEVSKKKKIFSPCYDAP